MFLKRSIIFSRDVAVAFHSHPVSIPVPRLSNRGRVDGALKECTLTLAVRILQRSTPLHGDVLRSALCGGEEVGLSPSAPARPISAAVASSIPKVFIVGLIDFFMAGPAIVLGPGHRDPPSMSPKAIPVPLPHGAPSVLLSLLENFVPRALDEVVGGVDSGKVSIGRLPVFGCGSRAGPAVGVVLLDPFLVCTSDVFEGEVGMVLCAEEDEGIVGDEERGGGLGCPRTA